MNVVDGEWEVKYRGSKPQTVIVELTTRCNLSCRHCFRNAMMEDLGDMSRSLVEKLLEDLASVGVKRVVFTGFGEPLVYPYIDQVLERAKSLGFEVVLNTNGTLLDRYIEAIAEFVDTLVVSIEAGEEDLYKEIRRGATLSKVLENLELLNKFRSVTKWSPIIEFWYTIGKYNLDSLLKVIDLAQRMGVYRLNVSNYIPIASNNENCCLCDPSCIEKLRSLAMEVSKLVMEKPPLVHFSSPTPLADRLCPYVTRRAMFVRFDGRVTPCMHYAHRWRFALYGIEREIKPVLFGDLSRSSVAEVWSSRQYLEFRYRTYFARYPSCITCRLAPYCSYTLTNEFDCLGYTPTCAHCPYIHGIASCPI